jgi:hypothetical protein
MNQGATKKPIRAEATLAGTRARLAFTGEKWAISCKERVFDEEEAEH